MQVEFKPAVREGLGLIVGLAGGTGSGKTYSAMRLASGMANGKPFAVADSENGRAKFYADYFRFDHAKLVAPFRPKTYLDAIMAADAAGYPVILVDNVSHVWAGDGGCLDWHEEILNETIERQRKTAAQKGWNFDEWKVRQSANMAAWIEPKMAHKQFVEKLLQLRAHLIMCFRAETKVEMRKETDDKTGREKTVVGAIESPVARDGWVPICEKKLPYEMTTFLLVKADNPGLPVPITLREPHRPMFPPDRPIDEQAGVALAKWASGADRANPELAAVLVAISAAQSMPELEATAERCAKLPADDKKRAKEAYARRGGQLKA